MSLESIIADCHRRGYRVADLSELRAEPGIWRARLWTRDDQDTDFSTGRTAEAALKGALAEITGAPGSERARAAKKSAPRPAPKSSAPVARPTPPTTPFDLDDLLAL